MAVPRHLVASVRRSEVKVSLRTTDPLAAKVRSRLLSNAFDVLFKGLPTMPQVTTGMIDERIRDYFQGCLNKSLEHTQLLPADPFNDIGREVAYLRDSVEQMRSQLAAQSFSSSVIQDATELLQQPAGSSGAPDPEALQYACSTVLRAKIENARILAAQLSGRYDETAPKDPLFVDLAPDGLPPIRSEALPVSPKVTTLQSVADLFLAFKAKHDFADKTTADVKRVMTLAYEVVGAEKPVRSVDTDDVKALLHRSLIDVGLIDAVAKAKPKGRLFPEIEPGADGYPSHNLSKWWGRYGQQVGFHTPRTAFHSFRHNFKDALQAAEVPEFIAKALMGHADNSVHAQYGSGPPLAVLREHLDRVEWQPEDIWSQWPSVLAELKIASLHDWY